MTTTIDLTGVLERHRKWMRREPGGEWADLGGANLYGANLGGHIVLQIGPIGSRRDYLQYVDGTVRTGCFSGTLAEFAAAVAGRHGDTAHGRAYRAAIALLEAFAAQHAARSAAEGD